MTHVNVFPPERFLAMIDKLVDESDMSRPAPLGQLLMVGLRSHVDMQREAARHAGEPRIVN
jgi:hypothetical protein